MTIAVPIALLARKASHPAMTLRGVIIVGLVSAVVSFGFYITRYLLAAPRSVSISDSGLTVEKRDGAAREALWSEIEKAKFVNRWGDKWQFRLPDRNVLVRGEGFPQLTWDHMRKLIIERLIANSVPFRLYGVSGNCTYEFKGAANQPERPRS